MGAIGLDGLGTVTEKAELGRVQDRVIPEGKGKGRGDAHGGRLSNKRLLGTFSIPMCGRDWVKITANCDGGL
jgi:hypothetical protein